MTALSTAGQWVNSDGLLVTFGAQKAQPDLATEYAMPGGLRVIEALIPLCSTTFGTLPSGGFTWPGLPNGFNGTSANSAGILSINTLMPVPTNIPTKAIGANNSTQLIQNTGFYISQVDVEVLVSANAGTGGATGFSLGLAYVDPITQAIKQFSNGAGQQLTSVMTNTALVAGMKWTFWGGPGGAGAGTTQTYPATASAPTAGYWVGNFNSWSSGNEDGGAFPVTPYNVYGGVNAGMLSAIAVGGTYSGSNASGLVKARVYYYPYGVTIA
jgi:hypothetical protein